MQGARGQGFEGPSGITKAKIKKIKTLQGKLKLDDEQYRLRLSDYWVKSCTDLSEAEADKFIEELTKEAVAKGVWTLRQAQGDKKYDSLGKRPGMGSPKQLRMIEAMWAKVSFTHDPHKREMGLRKFCLRIAGVDDITFLTSQGVQKVIKAIQSMQPKHTPVYRDRAYGGI